MYSPKIDETLVPRLYWLAKERGMPMTRLVDGLIRRALDIQTALPKTEASASVQPEQKKEAA